VLQAVGVLPVASILGATAGLHIRGFPGLRTQCPQERGGMGRPRPDLHVIGLQERTALLVPIGLEFQNDLLEGEHKGAAGPNRRPALDGATAHPPGDFTRRASQCAPVCAQAATTAQWPVPTRGPARTPPPSERRASRYPNAPSPRLATHPPERRAVGG